MKIANTIGRSGWSDELQDLQEETLRLLHTVRADREPRHQQHQQQQQGQNGHIETGKLRGKSREQATAVEECFEGTSNNGRRAHRRRRRRKRGHRKGVDASQAHVATGGDGITGQRGLLDPSTWRDPNGTGSSGLPSSWMGVGKTTVEILDRGEETPRSPPLTRQPSGQTPRSVSSNASKAAAALTAAGEDESRFRSLTFKDEEDRVRDKFDVYVPGNGGLGEELLKLRAERDRLAGIEDAQREACRGEKRKDFLRFARRRWLASDLAAESIQRIFRGYIGRKRAALNAEVWRLTGEARGEWVEVRDHNRGEAWYFNPLTGKSQWDRPESLLGTITPSEKVRTLPDLGSSSPSKKWPTEEGYGMGTSPKRVKLDLVSSPLQSRQNLIGTFPRKPTGSTKANAANSTLPPLMKGSRLSVLSPDIAAPSAGDDLAPSSGRGGTQELNEEGEGGRWRNKQQAWVDRGHGGGDRNEEELFPFLAEDEMVLPDDRFEETGLGLARRADQDTGSEASEDSHDDPNRSKGFFLADGTPNILLRRTIAKALRVTKFDSVSTLLADYAGRRIAAAAGKREKSAGTMNASSPLKTRRRAATAAPISGGYSTGTGEKHRRNTDDSGAVMGKTEVGGGHGATVARVRLDSDAPYPTGKLEEDKTPSLFASSPGGGGRKMVSLMVEGIKKGGSSRGGVRRRAKIAGIIAKGQSVGEKGASLKGLAIRDLTPPGFSPSTTAAGGTCTASPTVAAASTGEGDSKDVTTSARAAQDGDISGATAPAPAPAPGRSKVNGASTGRDQSGKRLPAGNEAAIEATDAQKVKEVCFNCWSKGSGKTCTLHSGGVAGKDGGGGGGSGGGGRAGSTDGQTRMAESVLMCQNWDVSVMRRRYRSEELQEVFAIETSSLRYDKERKKFISTVEQRHPIYRLLAKMIAGYNFTVRRKLHQKNWMRGFVEQLRIGKVVGVAPERARKTARLLRLRNTLQNTAQVKAFTDITKHTQPQAPITGTTLAERRGLVKVLVDRPSSVMKRVTRVVLDGPTPVPQDLYEARRYSLPAAKMMPMPEPRYPDEDDDTAYMGALGDANVVGEGAAHASWMPLLCKTAVEDILRSATTNVEVMSPVPGADEIGPTKHPPALTIKFATFSRKPTPGMMAVGGLPAEMVVHMLVSTRMSPQYGNFTVMQKSSVAPTVSEERSADYETLDLLVENQAFLPRALQHPLNSRRAPTVMMKTLMSNPEDRHFYGLNRPEQTGEAESHGFRTSANADAAPALPTLDPTAFTPSEEVVTPNLCSANRTVTTHADRSYPFCEPSNRSNTTLDFYHLLLTATCSPNKEQVFTNLGAQECGEFMRGSDPMRPMGHCIGVVYRSWAFLQRQVLEEFETDDGVPYWFDRRTGETFWERPLCEEEKVPVKQGGTILDGQGEPPDSSSGAFEDIKPRYDQQQMRRLMMKSYEGTDALERRRKQVSTGVKWARESGALPPPDPSDLKPPTPTPEDFDRLESEGDESSSVSREGSRTQPPSASTSSSISRTRSAEEKSPQSTETTSGVGDGGRKRGGAARRGRKGKGSGSKADRLAASISQALKDAGLNEGRSVKSSDMLRFGMGLGITLGANGLLGELGGSGSRGSGEPGSTGSSGASGRSRIWRGETIEATGGVEDSLAPPVVKISPNGHPIGHGHTEPIAEKEDSTLLDHKSEADHLASVVQDSAALKTSEEFKGLLVIAPEPTPCPDEDYGISKPEDVEVDPRRKLELSNPIIAYPETLWKKQYRGHGAAGEGQSWQPAGSDRTANQRAKSSLGATLRRTKEVLPEGFLNAISHTHVGKQARAVGRVKPRSAAEDWFAVGFDPWSAGREPLTAEFIPTLSIKQEDLGGNDDLGGVSLVPQTGYLELKDSAGHAEMAVVSAEEAKMARDFEQITSWARHARYADVETAMNQADWMMPVDYQNDQGLTLLHVAAQNGNKRIAKLCLRRGADVNKRNNNGQTPLHYAYSYGFESLGEYLISKGADDSIVNADGLTCYEGLNEDNIKQL